MRRYFTRPLGTDGWHVVPMGDIRDHISGSECWCHPVQDGEEPTVWIHNSMDGREHTIEQGKVQ